MINLKASALNRVVQCNGSVFMPEPEVSEDSEQSEDRREGIAAHWLAMEVISGRFTDPIELVDRKAPNGVWITPEMAEFTEPFIQDVFSRGATLHIEQTVDFQLSPQTFIKCRLDLATWDGTTLTIDEFKYGRRIVEPENNWQLVAEAIGWMMKHDIQPNRVVLNVHQPRPHHSDGKKRSWTFETLTDFVALASGVLVAKLESLQQVLNSGPNCYECPHRAGCEALRRAGGNTIDASGRVFRDDLTNDELAFEYENMEAAIKRAENLRDAYKELLTHRIQAGNVFQTHAFEQVLGNTRLKEGVTPAMIAATSGIPISKLTKTVSLTPGQMIKAGASELVVKAFSERPFTGFKLVRKSADKRASAMFKPPTE